MLIRLYVTTIVTDIVTRTYRVTGSNVPVDAYTITLQIENVPMRSHSAVTLCIDTRNYLALGNTDSCIRVS